MDEEAVASIAMEVGVAKREAEIVRCVLYPFNGHFPVEPGSAGYHQFFILHLFWKETFED